MGDPGIHHLKPGCLPSNDAPSPPAIPAHLISHPRPISTDRGLLWKTTTLNSYKLPQLHVASVALTLLPTEEVPQHAAETPHCDQEDSAFSWTLADVRGMSGEAIPLPTSPTSPHFHGQCLSPADGQ